MTRHFRRSETRLLPLALVLTIITMTCAPVVAAKPSPEKEAQQAAKVKASILKLGTGPAARVELKLRDGQQLKGYVSEASGESFWLVDDKTGVSKEVPYPQVKQVKGNNLSTGAKIAIGVGVAIVVLIVALKDHIVAY